MKRSNPGLLFLTGMLLLLAAILAGMPQPGRAQEGPAGLTMRVEPAFQGNFKYGEWLPVWVELENNGADLEAELRIPVAGSQGTTVFALPVSLPGVSRKQVTIYALPNNFTRELEVQLVSGDQLLASQKAQVSGLPNNTYLIGISSPERGALGLLQGVELAGQQRRDMKLTDFPIDQLPERVEGLRAFNLLVLNQVDTSTLNQKQTGALESWVRQGGRLVIGGGAGAALTAGGLPEALLPIRPDGDASLENLPELAAFAGTEAIRTPGPFLAATGETLAGRTLVLQDGTPLVQEAGVGNGSVDFVALDLSAAPFDAWSGAADFWKHLIEPGSAYPDWLPPDISPRFERASQLGYALSNLPSLDLPSVKSLAVLLVLYILLIGPANYLALRWLRKMHWAWFTIPVLTALFTAGAFGLGYTMRGSDLIMNKIALVEANGSGGAKVTGYLGLFSPGNQSYTIIVDGEGLLSPMNIYYDPWGMPAPGTTGNEMVFVQGEPGEVRGLSVNQWSMQSFISEADWPEFGPLNGELRLEGTALVGEVRNETGVMLQDVIVALGRDFVRLGDMAPGASAEVELELSNQQDPQKRFGPPLSYLIFEEAFQTSGMTGPPREAEMKRTILESAIERGPMISALSSKMPAGGTGAGQAPVLFGWLESTPPNVQVGDREVSEQTTGLAYTRLSYSLPAEGEITLPPGLLSGTLVQTPFEGGMCGDQTSLGVYISRGEAVFEFQVPEEVRQMQVRSLDLYISSDGGWWDSPETAVFNWEANDWRILSEVVAGTNKIKNTAGLVNEQGQTRVRLSAERAQGCYFVALGLTAAPGSGQGGVQ